MKQFGVADLDFEYWHGFSSLLAEKTQLYFGMVLAPLLARQDSGKIHMDPKYRGARSAHVIRLDKVGGPR